MALSTHTMNLGRYWPVVLTVIPHRFLGFPRQPHGWPIPEGGRLVNKVQYQPIRVLLLVWYNILIGQELRSCTSHSIRMQVCNNRPYLFLLSPCFFSSSMTVCRVNSKNDTFFFDTIVNSLQAFTMATLRLHGQKHHHHFFLRILLLHYLDVDEEEKDEDEDDKNDKDG